MRFSQWLLGGATTAAIACAIASGCGGSTNNNTPVEAGTVVDATPEAAKEAAAETGPQDAAPEACAVDADLSSLQVPDASIGDSGATTAECYSCIETTCSSQLTTCNGDCTCKTDIITFITCVGGGGQILTCGGPLLTGGDPAALALLVCTGGSAAAQLGGSGPGCLKPCGVTLPEGGAGEGGAGEGGGGEGGGEGGGDGAVTDATGQ